MIDTKKRFVAFIDILGFKSLVDNNTHSFVYDKLLKHIESIKEINTNDSKIRRWTFSASILIVTKNDSEDCADSILFHTSALITESFKLGLLWKGAIAYGKFTTDYENSIFFGKPIIDAHLLQEEMKVSSVVLHHTAEKQLKKMQYKLVNLLHNGGLLNITHR